MIDKLKYLLEDIEDSYFDVVETPTDERILALANYLDVDPNLIENESWYYYRNLDDNKLYLVVTYEEAQEEVEDRIREVIRYEDIFECYNLDYLENFIDVDSFEDEVDYYANDMVNYDLGQEDTLEYLHKFGIITDEEFERRSELDPEELEFSSDELDKLVDSIKEDELRNNTNSYEWFYNTFGEEETLRYLKNNVNACLDIEALIEEIVETSHLEDWLGGYNEVLDLGTTDSNDVNYYAYRYE